MLEGKHHSAEDCNYVESLKEEIKYFRAEKQMKTAIIKAMSERENSLVPCLYSAEAPFLESSNGNPKLNSPNKSDCSEVLSNAVQITKENSLYKLPTISSENNRQGESRNVVSTERPKSDDIRNTSGNKNTRDIKVLVLKDSVVKHGVLQRE